MGRQAGGILMLASIGWIGWVGAASILAAAPQDGGIAFPADYKAWPKFLSDVQREAVKQVRELYVDPAGVRACPSTAFPNGTRLVMELYKAKPEGNGLAKGADGKLMKEELAKVFVMEKNEGWGHLVPDNLKNGTWLFGAYGPDGQPLAEDFTKCRVCHAPLAQKDFVHRYDEFCAQGHKAH